MLVLLMTAATGARADYGWYNGSMTIGGATTDCISWSTDGDNPTDIGIVTDMTITSIAFNVWSEANDRAGADMYFRIWDGGSSQVGEDQHLWLGDATRITGAHDFAISWTGTMDLAAAVGLNLEIGKTYYIDMWAKTYKSDGGNEWYSGDNGSNYHAKLTYDPTCGDGVTWSLSSGVLTISKTGSGTGAMEDYNPFSTPWYSNKDDITSVVIESGVTTIGDYAFFDCNKLASVNIPASVTSIGEAAFRSCGTSATALTVTFATGSTLATIGSGAFRETNLTSITIPASVTSIGETAFKGCGNLATVTLNSNPFIGDVAFPDDAAVTMNLSANSAAGTRWTTFYNQNYRFQADEKTQLFKVTLSGDQLTMHEVEDKITQEGSGYVLKTTGDGNPVMTLTSLATTDNVTSRLDGVAVPDGLTADDDGYIFVLNYTAANGVGFYRLASGKKVGVGKAYLFYNGSLAREFFSFDEATGISATQMNNEEVNGEVYDLQGRRVSQPAKGLYIVNGKKYIKK